MSSGTSSSPTFGESCTILKKKYWGILENVTLLMVPATLPPLVLPEEIGVTAQLPITWESWPS
jgi:hypothetical protein